MRVGRLQYTHDFVKPLASPFTECGYAGKLKKKSFSSKEWRLRGVSNHDERFNPECRTG